MHRMPRRRRESPTSRARTTQRVPTQIIPTNGPLFLAKFRNAGELYLYLQDNPEVLSILRARALWSYDESNPLLELTRVDMQRDEPPIPIATLRTMLKVVLMFEPNLETKFYTTMKEIPKKAEDYIELKICWDKDPKGREMVYDGTIADPLQLAAYCAKSGDRPPLVKLLIEDGFYSVSTGALYDLRRKKIVKGKNAEDFALRAKNGVEGFITKHNKFVCCKIGQETLLRKQLNISGNDRDTYVQLLKIIKEHLHTVNQAYSIYHKIKTVDGKMNIESEIYTDAATQITKLFEKPAFLSRGLLEIVRFKLWNVKRHLKIEESAARRHRGT